MDIWKYMEGNLQMKKLNMRKADVEGTERRQICSSESKCNNSSLKMNLHIEARLNLAKEGTYRLTRTTRYCNYGGDINRIDR